MHDEPPIPRFAARAKRRGVNLYIFFRKEGWYPVEAKDDADVLRHVPLNPGTLRVENVEGRVIWPNA